MKCPKVSLVTPSCNLGPFLERTLRSVLCQDYSNIEYIVLDACSTDDSIQILERYAHALDVLIIAKDDGQSDALDRGFQLATGEILGYLNADDCLATAQTISQVVQRFADNPSADVIYGQRAYMDERGDFVLRYPYRPFCQRTLYLADYLPQEATFWRRDIYETAGGRIDVSFDFAMDYELWLRFLEVGARFLSVRDNWGLFRWYPRQKSNAMWRTKGLPEIARLYDAHLGYRVSEQDMVDYFMGHYYGAHPRKHAEAYKFYHHWWSKVQGFTRTCLQDKPLDHWVHQTPLNLDRIVRLRNRQGQAVATKGNQRAGAGQRSAPSLSQVPICAT